MAYLQPEIRAGYNAYLDMKDNPEVGMDVGLLVLKPGQSWESGRPDIEIACLLLEGEAIFHWDGLSANAIRRSPFQDEAYCLHTGPGIPFSIQAATHTEIYVQAVMNPGIRMSCWAPCAGRSKPFSTMNPPPGARWCWARC